MNISFDYNEMKNFILHTGKYKMVNVKVFVVGPPRNWYQFSTEEEVDMEVAYLIDDIESEKWIFDERDRRRRKDEYYMFTIESAFYREFKSKLLNL